MQIKEAEAPATSAPPPAAPAPLVAIFVPPPAPPLAIHVPSSASLITALALPVADQATPPAASITSPVVGTSFMQYIPVTGKISFFYLNYPLMCLNLSLGMQMKRITRRRTLSSHVL